MYLAKLYFQMLTFHIRSQMQYRFSFFLDTFTTGFLNIIYFFTLSLVLERFNNIAGWTLPEIAFLAGMAEMSFATMDLIFSGFDPDSFSVRIQQGNFDQLLLRPVPITLQVLGSQFLLRRIGRILQGVLIFIIALALGNIHWTVFKLLYLPVVFISQVLCMGAINLMGSTMIFWTIQRVEAINILSYGGVEMVTYPMNIYPAWLRAFFTYIIPFMFINYFPALYFLDKPDPLGFPAFAPFIAPFAACALFGAAFLFWKFGVNHYQSTGS